MLVPSRSGSSAASATVQPLLFSVACRQRPLDRDRAVLWQIKLACLRAVFGEGTDERFCRLYGEASLP